MVNMDQLTICSSCSFKSGTLSWSCYIIVQNDAYVLIVDV